MKNKNEAAPVNRSERERMRKMKPPKKHRTSRALRQKVDAPISNAEKQQARAVIKATRSIFKQKTRTPANSLLFWAKFYKQLQLDSRVAAKNCARNLKASWIPIAREAQKGNRQFFIDLGKCLSGEIDSTLYEKSDYDLADIVGRNPSISAREGVREMIKRGHREVTEETFRMRKHRLMRNAREAREIWEKKIAEIEADLGIKA
jgi:hypothetical protein